MATTQSKIQISDGELSQLRNLLHMTIDSRDGFAYAGKRLAEKHSTHSMRFHRYSQQRNEFYDKLKEIVEASDEEPVERGTIAASMHRTWMELKDELEETVDVSSVIVEAHRGEGYIKQAYEIAISKVVEPRLLTILKHQLESIEESFSWLDGLTKDEEKRRKNAS